VLRPAEEGADASRGLIVNRIAHLIFEAVIAFWPSLIIPYPSVH
jgi:hypothetical protein